MEAKLNSMVELQILGRHAQRYTLDEIIEDLQLPREVVLPVLEKKAACDVSVLDVYGRALTGLSLAVEAVTGELEQIKSKKKRVPVRNMAALGRFLHAAVESLHKIIDPVQRHEVKKISAGASRQPHWQKRLDAQRETNPSLADLAGVYHSIPEVTEGEILGTDRASEVDFDSSGSDDAEPI